MFERVAGVSAEELTAGADETIARVRRQIADFGFERRESFFEWRPEGGIDDYLPVTQGAAAPPIT